MKNWEYKEASEYWELCNRYAQNYNEMMLEKIEEEQPDFFETNKIDRTELFETLNNNMCVQFGKLKSIAFRKATAEIVDKEYLTDHIRRLYNGGDRFHPYF